MPFMRPEVYESDYIEIDGPMGTDIIPCDVVDYRPTAAESNGSATDRFEIPDALRDYTDMTRAYSIERKHGFVGRMTAPGYMDCTPWSACATKAEMFEELSEYYGEEGTEE